MLKTIRSSVSFHESNYTVVDVKFETGPNAAMDSLTSNFEDSNSFQQSYNEEDDEDLQTPNTSPPHESTSFNKRKRSVPKKFSVDEDENPLQVSGLAVVKTEQVDYSQHSYEDIAEPETSCGAAPALTGAEDWDEAALDQIDLNRINAAKINSKQRDDCPICGDKANGLHYGVYTCEGCKNFFKRSVVMTQKKPYICNNANSCDVRIVIDMSGIKRKGARCQACRYTACLDAGMFHSGYPRSRGGRHSHPRNSRVAVSSTVSTVSTVSTPLLKEFLNCGGDGRTDKKPRMSLEEVMESGSWNGGMLSHTPHTAQGEVPPCTWSTLQEGGESSNQGGVTHQGSHDTCHDTQTTDCHQRIAKATEMYDTVIRDDLEKERSKVRELTSRLVEKEKQLKIVERQAENMKRHMVVSQGVNTQLQEENKKLRNEINRLTVFRSTVRNYQEQNSNLQEQNSNYKELNSNYHEQNSNYLEQNSNNGDHDNELIPSDMLTVSYTE